MSTNPTKWTKIERGFYRLDGTLYAVQSDGYQPSKHIGAEESTGYEGFAGGEWAVIRYRDEADAKRHGGENLDWFPTMREARAEAEGRARFDANWDAAGERMRR